MFVAPESVELTQFLITEGHLSPEKGERLLQELSQSSESVIGTLRRLQFIPEGTLLRLLSRFHKIPYVDLQSFLIDPATIDLLPKEMARNHTMLPLCRDGGAIKLALADPANATAIQAAQKQMQLEIQPVLCSEKILLQAIDTYYGMKAHAIEEEPEWMIERVEMQSTAPAIQIVDALLKQALKERASDIHIEPEEKLLQIRFRVDGVLQEVASPPKSMHPAFVSRIKVMSSLDISESRLPQDGRFEIPIENRRVDVRVSTFPTTYGEKVVMRLLDHSAVLRKLADLGLTEENQKSLDRLIHLPHGLILVTGPTGSGKTSSLYSVLQIINKPEINIITVEDPVEYQLAGVRQSQVNAKIGMTFARGLRSILRQDPDVILVGEIRDKETAEIAIQAALTGHLVFSTLHTNDASSAPTRLVDMGVEPFLIGSSLVAVLAQRLVRLLCKKCKSPHTLKPDELEAAGFRSVFRQKDEVFQFYRPKGCPSCRHTGYSGRTGIFELLSITDDLRSEILKKGGSYLIKEIALKHGMATLREDGYAKVQGGVTSLEEVIRVTQLD